MASIRSERETEHLGRKNTSYELDNYGIREPARVYWNLTAPELYEEIARRNEGVLSDHGALIVDTGEHTGRAAKDKAIVREPGSLDKVFWGDINKDLSQEKFNALKERMMAHARRRDLFVQDTFAGADANYRLPVRIITELAWHSLFARTMFISNQKKAGPQQPEFTVINFPSFQAEPQRDGTRSPTFILMDFSQKLVLIGGTSYAGETKKSVFTLMNYLLPQRGVMSMHCSANVGAAGDVAIFFGLSGTGKTTLSADPERRLIGDDEHGWSDDGVFNFEGGCYAKCINLKEEKEPEIFHAIRPGALVENVTFYPGTDRINFEDGSITENTRVSYPLSFISNALEPSIGNIPKNIFFLTCDAYGVLPPISRLTPDQAAARLVLAVVDGEPAVAPFDGRVRLTLPAGRGQNLDRRGGRGPRLLRQRAGGQRHRQRVDRVPRLRARTAVPALRGRGPYRAAQRIPPHRAGDRPDRPARRYRGLAAARRAHRRPGPELVGR